LDADDIICYQTTIKNYMNLESKPTDPNSELWSRNIEELDTESLPDLEADIVELHQTLQEVAAENSLEITVPSLASNPEVLRDLSELAAVIERYLASLSRAEQTIAEILSAPPAIVSDSDKRYQDLLILGRHSPNFYYLGLAHLQEPRLRTKLVVKLVAAAFDGHTNEHDALVALVNSLYFVTEPDLIKLVLEFVELSGSRSARETAAEIVAKRHL
jgi:hypothetical protein